MFFVTVFLPKFLEELCGLDNSSGPCFGGYIVKEECETEEEIPLLLGSLQHALSSFI